MSKGQFWTNPSGVKLATYSWPAKEEKFLVYISHGYHEHAQRYQALAEEFNKIGGSVFAHDHFGHGESGPLSKDDRARYEILDLHAATEDLDHLLKTTRENNPGKPLILYGHSMGGLLSIMLAISSKTPPDGLALEAPAIKIHPKTGAWWQILGAKILSKVWPSCKVGKVEIDLISRNPDTRKSIDEDPLCETRGGSSAGFAYNFIKTQDEIVPQLDRIKLKTFLATGTDDFLTCKTGADLAAEKIENVEYKIYEGGYHQLHADLPETTDAYLKDLKKFLSQFY